jgi:hypothetical protein
MPACTTDGPARPRTAGARLLRLADLLDEAFLDPGQGLDTTDIYAVGLIGSLKSARAELAMRPLPDHPVECLLGWVAPPAWSVVGVVTTGTSRPIPQAGPPSTPPGRVRVIHLVSRSGTSASICRTEGGVLGRRLARGLHDALGGRVDDLLRRVLGLATRPPRQPPRALWTAVWLDRVLAAAAAEPGSIVDWPDVARLHPIVSIVDERAPDLSGEAIDRLARLVEMHDGARPWAALRAACADGSWPVDAVPAEIAAWMDDGMFSRWVLDAPPPAASLGPLGDLLAPALCERIRDSLSAWGLPTEPDQEGW